MPPPIGFVILSHDKPRQLERLVRRLNVLFDDPPVVCHHDFDQCDIHVERFAKNVTFVRPHLRTSWGAFTFVEAVVRALNVLYARPDSPGLFVLLSGTDYPIKPAATVLADLRADRCDAHVHFMPVVSEHDTNPWAAAAFKRYRSVYVPVPFTQRRLALHDPTVSRFCLPFSDRFRCFAGTLWFSGNRRAAQRILKFHASRPAVIRHYRRVVHPEESYFITILANEPDLALSNNCWRFTDWRARDSHPKDLGIEDVAAIAASRGHFARKFDVDRDALVLDEL